MPEFIKKDFKSILNKYKYLDSWFWCRYSINPYNGCQFGCVYCDSRSQKYHLPLDFENKITIKNNVATLLDNKLSRARTLLADVVVLSGTTDPYQPAERKFRNTRQCLEVLLKHKYPVHIITKSTSVLDDLDILHQIAKQTWCSISLTITTPKKEIAKFLEKGAPSPEERFFVIKEVKQKAPDIQCGVLLIPIVPHLTDNEEDLLEIVKQSKFCNADYLLFGSGMTLRDMQANWFLKKLIKNYPNLKKKYELLYNFNFSENMYNGNYGPLKSYTKKVNLKLLAFCKEANLNYRIKRYIPADYRRINYLIAEKFLNASYKNQIIEKQWKKSYWAGHDIQNLKESLVDLAQKNNLQSLKNVDKQVEGYVLQFIKELS